jgi:hypothetical protein
LFCFTCLQTCFSCGRRVCVKCARKCERCNELYCSECKTQGRCHIPKTIALK